MTDPTMSQKKFRNARVSEAVPQTAPFAHRAGFLKAIAHPVRLEIIEELSKGMKCVSDINDILNDSQPNVSKHLNVLRRAGIVDFKKDKQQRCYFIRAKSVASLLKFLAALDKAP